MKKEKSKRRTNARKNSLHDQPSQALSLEKMELILNGRSEINETLKKQMLDLLEVVVETPITQEAVGEEYYKLWYLKGEIGEEVWDEILGAVLGLQPGEATDFALAYEDRHIQATAHPATLESAASLNGEAEAAGSPPGSTSEGGGAQDTAPSEETLDATSPPQGGEKMVSDAKTSSARENTEPDREAASLEIVDPGGKTKKRKNKGQVESLALVPARNAETLSQKERTLLKKCQDVIFKGLDMFVQVGSAIATIIEEKLYRETHQKFEQYAEEVLGMTPRRAYQLKDASEVIDHLKEVNKCSHDKGEPAELPLPTNENQVRALKKFPPDVQCEIWREAVTAAGAKRVTGKLLVEIIRARSMAAETETSDQTESAEGNSSASGEINDTEKVIAALNRFLREWPEPKRPALFDAIHEWLRDSRESAQ